jgi:acyl-CoA thioesterase
MGDIGLDTQVTEVDDPAADGARRFTALVKSDWEIWGPEGGYVAAIALRAAGAASPFDRPASFFCHYLSVAAFEPVDLVVTPLRSGRTVLAQRVEMTQQGRPILHAMVWSVGQVEGLVHSDLRPPQVADPDALKSWEELMPDGDGPPFRFWDNFDQRPIDYVLEWPPPGPLEPTWRTWLRAAPSSAAAPIDDPWVDAARTLIVLDVMSWPAGHRPHAHVEHGFIAPSLDLYASFQHLALGEEWLLLDGHSPVADDGLLSWNGRVWTRDFRLVASGGGQALFRHA